MLVLPRSISARARDRLMETFPFVCSAHFLTLQLHAKCFPLSTSNVSSVPTSSWRVKAIRPPHASLTWVRKRRHSTSIHVTALLNGDGGDVEHLQDDWDAMDASQIKALLWQALQRWGLPVAIGALVGSVIARQAVIFVISSSFLVFMSAHKVLEAGGGHLRSVSDVFSRDSLCILLKSSKSITARVVAYLSVACMACGVYRKRMSMHIHLLLARTWACLGVLAANKQGFLRRRRDLSSPDRKSNLKYPAFKSQRESIICDIDACIQKVEGVMQTENEPPLMYSDTGWNVLRDNLALLKAMVAHVPLKGAAHSNDAPTTQGSTVERSVKFQTRKRKHVDVDKVQSSMVEVHDIKEDSVQDSSNDWDVVKKIEDKFSGHAYHVADKDALHSVAAPVLNGAVLDQNRGLLSSELSREGSVTSPMGLLDAVVTLRAGERGSGSGFSSNASKTKYVDYWTQHDLNGSESPSCSSEQKKEGLISSNDHQKEGLLMLDNRVIQGEHGLEVSSLHADKENFWVEEPQLFVSIGNPDKVKVSFKNFQSGNLTEQKAGGHQRQEPESPVVNSKSNLVDKLMSLESADANPTSLTREKITSSSDEIVSKSKSKEQRKSRSQNGWSPNGLEQDSSQHVVNGTNQTNNVVEPTIALLGSTKELAFVRENPDMHALTGFSRRVNDEEFQRLMNEGEVDFTKGKAGLLGKIEVGEAETMLYKAADLFASAADLDSSSVEAFGFWGNTLLVHGELKIMLSRELRYIISTPDIISSYQIKRSRINETRDNGNRVALQQAFRAVCEECEELLIQAGRKYRKVLSISNSEIRALYNWGLALCFRAQLIAEEGGQNACEAADKVYLAAIDKFEAIMGISRRYAPGAMLNWGLILRDRSRLRSMNSIERIDLLLQAKQLFQDALRLQPDDAQIQRASITCSVELKELQERKEFESKRSTRTFFGNR